VTPEEVKALIAGRLKPKKLAALTIEDFLAAWQALSESQKNQIVQSAIAGRTADAGQGLSIMLDRYSASLAEARAEEITADGTLNLAEISEIFD